MGNTGSQEENHNNKPIGDHAVSPQRQSSSQAGIHPLLKPKCVENRKPEPRAQNITVMAHSFSNGMAEEREQTHQGQEQQDQEMSGMGQSSVNIASQPSAMSIDGGGDEENHTPLRRRSTLILTDEPEFEKLKMARADESVPQSQDTSDLTVDKIEALDSKNATVPVEINWFQGGENVFITGSFTGWRKMIKLIKESDDKFSIKLKLPVGTHRFRFIVDNELRFSDYLPTATDQMGNFVNYIEIQSPEASQIQDQEGGEPVKKDSNLGLTNDDDDMGGGYSRFHEEAHVEPKYEYVRNIPAIFTDPSVMEQYYVSLDQQNQNQSWLTPPQLPPHLESVILNNYSNADKSNASGALPIPNHVVLNHLATTSIKHNTLAVASVVRYKRKYVTQVLYAPLQ